RIRSAPPFVADEPRSAQRTGPALQRAARADRPRGQSLLSQNREVCRMPVTKLLAASVDPPASLWSFVTFGLRDLSRPHLQRRLAQSLFLHGFRQRKRPELLQVLLDRGDAGTGKVRAKERFVRDLFQARKIFEQHFGRNAADVQMHVAMPPQQEE